MIFFGILFLISLFYQKYIMLLGIWPVPASLLISPFIFLVSDLATEVYGFKVARNLLYSGVLVLSVFLAASAFIAHLAPAPRSSIGIAYTPELISSYPVIFSGFLRIYIVIIFTTLVSDYINIFVMSKWKIILKGRFFCLRSVGASLVGLLLCSFTGVILSPYHFTSPVIFKITMISFLIKITVLALLSYIMQYVCVILRHAEKLDVYDYNENYNPFKM